MKYEFNMKYQMLIAYERVVCHKIAAQQRS
jgi:hypothetical protein